MAKFQLKKNTLGQFYWVFKANNGETVAVSEGYTSRSAAVNGITVIKQQAWSADDEDLTQQVSQWR